MVARAGPPASAGDTAPFGETVRSRRLEKRITLREMGRKLGVSAAYVSDIELGRRNAPLGDLLSKIADALGLSRDDLEAKARVARRTLVINLQQRGRSSEQLESAAAFARQWEAGQIDDAKARKILEYLGRDSDE